MYYFKKYRFFDDFRLFPTIELTSENDSLTLEPNDSYKSAENILKNQISILD